MPTGPNPPSSSLHSDKQKKHAATSLPSCFFVIIFVYLTHLRHLTSQNTLFSVFFNC